MRRQLTYVLLASVAMACAASAATSALAFRPSGGPLRYARTSVENTSIDTPMGSQDQATTTEATVALEVGAPSAGGHQVSVQFESLSIDAGMAGQFEGGDLLGKQFTGTLENGGTMTIQDGPDVPTRLATVFDPKDVLTDLMPPLPPGGDAGAQSWPVHREWVAETQFTLKMVTDGTAQIVGDTTWNGQPAQIIAVEGQANVSGSGTPEGAPGEVTLTSAGTYTSRYVWDGSRGIMLGSVSESNLEGNASLPAMGLEMTLTMNTRTTTELQR
jgi:hypothetical protein